MRIPNTTSAGNLVTRLQQLTARQAKVQDQVSSGQRITDPSDDPAAMARVLRFASEKTQIQQWARNNDRATEISEASFAALKGLKTTTDRAGELTVLASGTAGPEALQAYAMETDQMLEQALQAANTQHGGEYLFGGTKSDSAPFTATRDASGKITGVTYNGAASAAQIRVSEGTPVSPYTDGAENQQLGAFLNGLVALRDGLSAGDTTAVQAARPALESGEDNLLGTISRVGATQTRLEAARTQNGARFTELEKLTGHETDVDVATSMVNLSQAQAAYEAALRSGATMLQTSLLDYIR
jgi:flagellar hook-associated protein 3 FlgL